MAGKGFISINLIANTQKYKRGMMNATSITQKFGTAAKLALAAAGYAALQFTKNAVEAAMKMETLATSFEIMLGSAKRATATIKDLQDFTARTPFELEGVSAAARQLLAAGVEARGLKKELKTLGDLASVTNVPLTDMAQIYSKAMNKGKLQAEELNQLADRGIPIMQELADMYGLTKNEIYDLGSEGLITFEAMQKAFERMTSEGGIAYNAMQKQSKTLSGVLSTIRDQNTEVLAKIGNQLMPIVTIATWKWNRTLSKTSKLLEDIGFKITNIKEEAEETATVELFGGLIAKVDNKVEEKLEKPIKKARKEAEFFRTEWEKTLDKLKAPTQGPTPFSSELGMMPSIDDTPLATTGTGTLSDQIAKWEEITEGIGAAQRALQTFGTVYASIMANNMMALNAQHEAEMASLQAREGGTADYAEKLDQLREKQRKERNEELKKQAQIKKAMAVFDAMLAIPRAYLEGLTAGAGLGGPALGGIYAGLAAAQMAAIAAVPTPSFAIGTTGFRGGLAKLHEGETILPPRTQVISKGMSKMRQPEGKAKIRLEKDEVVIALNKIMAEYKYKL